MESSVLFPWNGRVLFLCIFEDLALGCRLVYSGMLLWYRSLAPN